MKTPFKNKYNGNGYGKDTENRLIIKALLRAKRPLTRRQLSTLTGMEIASLCRALYNLTYRLNLLRIARIDVCPATGKRVYHYYFRDLKPGG